MPAPDEVTADPLDVLKDAWQPRGYCLGRAIEGPFLAFFIRDEKPMERLLEAGTAEELDALLLADYTRRCSGYSCGEAS